MSFVTWLQSHVGLSSDVSVSMTQQSNVGGALTQPTSSGTLTHPAVAGVKVIRPGASTGSPTNPSPSMMTTSTCDASTAWPTVNPLTPSGTTQQTGESSSNAHFSTAAAAASNAVNRSMLTGEMQTGGSPDVNQLSSQNGSAGMNCQMMNRQNTQMMNVPNGHMVNAIERQNGGGPSMTEQQQWFFQQQQQQRMQLMHQKQLQHQRMMAYNTRPNQFANEQPMPGSMVGSMAGSMTMRARMQQMQLQQQHGCNNDSMQRYPLSVQQQQQQQMILMHQEQQQQQIRHQQFQQMQQHQQLQQQMQQQQRLQQPRMMNSDLMQASQKLNSLQQTNNAAVFNTATNAQPRPNDVSSRTAFPSVPPPT